MVFDTQKSSSSTSFSDQGTKETQEQQKAKKGQEAAEEEEEEEEEEERNGHHKPSEVTRLANFRRRIDLCWLWLVVSGKQSNDLVFLFLIWGYFQKLSTARNMERESMESLGSADVDGSYRDDLEGEFGSSSPTLQHRGGRVTSGHRKFDDISDGESMRDSLDSSYERKAITSDPEAEYDDEDGDLGGLGERYGKGARDSFGDGSDDGSEDDDPHMRGNSVSNQDYSQLDVSAEVKELFDFIDAYKATDTDLMTQLKPFIPEYIPSVGDPDAFLKIAKPGSTTEDMGLVVLDEPGPDQSDPALITIILRNHYRQLNTTPLPVGGIENAEKNVKNIVSWVSKIQDLHRSKPPPNISYTRAMPDIESLMQEWPHEMERILETIKLPSASLDVDLKNFIRIICAVLDIPIYNNNLVEPLHVLFTLYSAFKENQHFGMT
ncbi:hypothetical protein PROFUN_09805 [Planoprotostelium fungivorum]|uniref:Intraflagellar transport protein 46 homolog n=1 Tax=Planoprotostelium fungivorum TaxID=1890364 RepID=A0A2P6NGN3_9EUKA|nr:hypothetical protein PROFUN_09805 [Planoprotostelium fungivorum]